MAESFIHPSRGWRLRKRTTVFAETCKSQLRKRTTVNAHGGMYSITPQEKECIVHIGRYISINQTPWKIIRWLGIYCAQN